MTRSTLIGLVLVLLLAACGGGAGDAQRDAGEHDDGGAQNLTIDDVMTPEPAAPDVAAVYMTIVNVGEEDRLLGAASDVAGTVEVHESIMEGGMARMEPVEALTVPAGGELVLERGGYNIMLLDVIEPLAQGDRFEVTLSFEHAGAITVESTVTARVGGGMDDAGHGDMGEDG
jgi:periplasmic copper chaperone A